MEPKTAFSAAKRRAMPALAAAVLMGLLSGCLSGGELEASRNDLLTRMGGEPVDAQDAVVVVEESAAATVSVAPTQEVTPEPTAPPTPAPTAEPSAEPTPEPTASPSPEAPADPTPAPTQDAVASGEAPNASDDPFENIPGVTMLPVSQLALPVPADLEKEVDFVASAFGQAYNPDAHGPLKESQIGPYVESEMTLYPGEAQNPLRNNAQAREYYNAEQQLSRFVVSLPLTTDNAKLTSDEIDQIDSSLAAHFAAPPSVSTDVWGNGYVDKARENPLATLASGGYMLRYWYADDATWIASIAYNQERGLACTLIGEPIGGTLATPAPTGLDLLLVRDLSEFYARNELNAARVYDGTFVLLQGMVQSIKRDENGAACVTFAAEGGGQMDPKSTYLFVCRFPAAQEEALMGLRAGQTATFCGMINGLTGERQGDQAVIELVRCSIPTSGEEAQPGAADANESNVGENAEGARDDRAADGEANERADAEARDGSRTR